MILEAAESKDFLIFVLLFFGVFLTGLYTGRLFFGVFHGPKRFLGHIHEPKPVMLWPLVPLAFGAVFLGYIEWPGQWLSHLLAESVGEAEPFVPSITTLIAGALGLAGFLLPAWRNEPATQPVAAAAQVDEHETEHVEALEPNVGWSDWLADRSYGLAYLVAGVQGGHLSRYIFVSVLGVAAILILTLAGSALGVTQTFAGPR
jgi:NADH:ubiquinone oxidoreductase subunit 5 (subunit L)/multisubunit Na+/H+ antiporter MnhA subunit